VEGSKSKMCRLRGGAEVVVGHSSSTIYLHIVAGYWLVLFPTLQLNAERYSRLTHAQGRLSNFLNDVIRFRDE
jgi:hypothetical protein